MVDFSDNTVVFNGFELITPEHVGLVASVYNGRLFQSFPIKTGMIGHRFGEFVLTKKIGTSIHFDNKKSRKKKNKK
jgi:ribosomal protein S19